MRELARAGKTVLFSTHVLAQAESIPQRLGVMGGGRVLAEGTAEEVCRFAGKCSLKEAFFSLVHPPEIPECPPS